MLGKGLGDQPHIQILRSGIDVDEDRLSPKSDHHIRCGRPGVTRDDHLVPGTDIKRKKTQVEGCRSAAHRNSVPGSDPGPHGILEGGDMLTLNEKPGPKNLRHLSYVSWVETWQGKPYHAARR
jgi:hypothetical protein